MGIRCLIPLALVVAVAAPAGHAAEAPVSVRVLTCSPWQDGVGGTVSYEARMRAVPGAHRMALRIRVLEKDSRGKYRPVHAEGLGVWRKSRPGAAGFRYEQQVRGLRKAAVYRAEVHYRWFDSGGARIRATERTSDPCRQPGGEPNLRVSDLGVAEGAVAETATYRVTVVNRGDFDARRIAVLLRVDGEVVDEAEVIEELKPGESRTVSFSGPICRRKLRAVVDPKNSISESNEEDNARAVSCV